MLKPSIYKAFYNNYKGYIISKELYKYKNIGIKEYIYKFKLFGKIVAVVFVALVATNFIGGDSPERTIIMKIMTQDKTRVLNFKMTYISYVSKNRICEGDFGIAEYASPERAKEVLNDMFQKYAAGEKAYIMPEE